MKILYVIPRSDVWGGASRHVYQIANNFQSRDHIVHVLFGGKGPLYKKFSDANIPTFSCSNLVRSISPLRDIKFLFYAFFFIRSGNYDIVHSHSFKAGLLCRALSPLLSGPKFIHTAHGWPFTQGIPSRLQKYFTQFIEITLSYFCSSIIVVSQYDFNLASSLPFYRVSALRRIYNSCAENMFNSDGLLSESMASAVSSICNNTSFVIVCIARFESQKDHVTLIRSLRHIQDLDFHVICLGSGPLLDSMKELSSDLCVREKISFLGEVSNVSVFLELASCFVLPSNWEGFPISILEAMKFKLPVIASDVGGVSEAVIDGKTGFLVPTKSDYVMSKKLSLLIHNRQICTEFGNFGFDYYYENFSEGLMFHRLEVLYGDLVCKNGV